jgi:hypothetical protein
MLHLLKKKKDSVVQMNELNIMAYLFQERLDACREELRHDEERKEWFE